MADEECCRANIIVLRKRISSLAAVEVAESRTPHLNRCCMGRSLGFSSLKWFCPLHVVRIQSGLILPATYCTIRNEIPSGRFLYSNNWKWMNEWMNEWELLNLKRTNNLVTCIRDAVLIAWAFAANSLERTASSSPTKRSFPCCSYLSWSIPIEDCVAACSQL